MDDRSLEQPFDVPEREMYRGESAEMVQRLATHGERGLTDAEAHAVWNSWTQ